MQKILKHYLKRLTNLGSGNKSILLLNLPSGQFFDLHELNFLNSKPSFEIIGQLISGRETIFLCDAFDSRFDKVNEESVKLKKLDRTEKFIEEERGARDLYVGYPMVRGKLSDGTLIRCPLLFFSVSLELRQNKWLLHQRSEEEITLNKSFLLAYAYYNNVSIADEWLETTFGDFSKDNLSFRTELYELLKRSPLEINFNQDLFTNKLQAFEKFSKPDFETLQKTGELKLFPEAVLGIFPQAGSYLVPDYQILLQQNELQSLEDFFLTKQLKSYSETIVREEQMFTPFALDASQESAIKAIKGGQSMVVQGPPGTGKSQLICNLIADYMARGKKILLVCQKRVALDVVYERLKGMEMSEFVGLVHDFKHDRKAIYEQIVSQIEKIDAYKHQNNSLDAIFLERTFLQECRKIDRISQELEEFRKALFDINECGVSVKELYLTSDPNLPHIPLGQQYRHFNFLTLQDFLQKLQYYEAYANKLERANYPWQNRVSFSRFTLSDLANIIQIITHIPVFQAEAIFRIEQICGNALNLEQTDSLNSQTQGLQNLLNVIQNQSQWEVFQQVLQHPHPIITDEWLKDKEQKLTTYVSGVGIEKSLPAEELTTVQQRIIVAQQARNGFFSWLMWQWFSKDKQQVETVASINGLGTSKEDLEILSQRVSNRIAADEIIAQLNTIRTLENPYELQVISQWFKHLTIAQEAKTLFENSAFLQQHAVLVQATYLEFKTRITALFTLLQEITIARNQWKQYLSEYQIQQLLQSPTLGQTLIQTVQEDFDSLSEIDRIKESMSGFQRDVTQLLWTYTEKSIQESEPQLGMIQLFNNSMRLAWIEHIELKYPILRAVSSLKLEQLEKELQESILKKMQIGQSITLLKAREQTYRNLTYNRLNNLITYRELKHQTGKKRNIWQMRKLFTAFSDEIFRLIPCWMASPESVSAIFQMETIFDLVIFDEASQCFAEKGIPAIYRGNQVVVTGDSQQLPPSDLYRVRFEEETADTPELEVDSLLDLAAHYFPQTQLNGHYRSKSLELIDFSNQHFYKNNLQLLPDLHQINQKIPAIQYIIVEGLWQDNTNQVEAEKILALVSTLTKQYSEKEIGVVTFNFKQQQLIQDLLEEYALKQGKNWPSSLFVKNIENVQGDERDIIIFSVGYAPDTKGKLNLQFGTLNMQGGENRLNVAVTRAREQIYIVSSILPVQLKIEDTLHKGPKLLKKYLEYALHVSEGKYVPAPKPAKDFEINRLLKDKLPVWQPDLVKELPFADLTLKEQELYRSLLLTDDDLYHQSLSAKEAHAYTPFLLKKMHWPFIRVYSREYWKDRVKLQERIKENL